jgi:hypothetical protein
VLLVAAKRWNARSPGAVERLLVALRYLDPAKRAEAYRDPEAWLDRLARLHPGSVAALAQLALENRAA